MLTSLKSTLLLALGALVLTAPSSAQIPLQPDYLWSGGFYSNPQCSLAPLTLPTFPGFNQVSMEIGWQDCKSWSQKYVDANWSAPMSPIGVSTQDMTAELRLTDALLGNLIAKGTMNLTYSRTWYEVKSTVPTRHWQIWRFLTNGDLRYTLGTKGSLLPSCAFSAPRQKGRVRYTGYVDWALNLYDGTWSNTWMLTHATDDLEHVPGYPRGGNFHCDRSYSFVGPAKGFVPDPLVASEWGDSPYTWRTVVRYVRRPKPSPQPFPPVPSFGGIPSSSFEEDVYSKITHKYEECPCGPPVTGPPQFAIAETLIIGNFGSTAQSNNEIVNEFVSMGIGRWTDPVVYPGVEDVRWTIAEMDYYEPCTNETRKEIFHGVTTLGGNEAWQISWSVPSSGLLSGYGSSTFIDQSNALRRGRLSMNLPFKSDHILNLNHD